MPTAEKEAFVEEFTARLTKARGLFLADFSGMDVAQVTALRSKLRSRGVEYHVVKNTLLRRACRNSGFEVLEPFLEGPTALAYSVDNEVEPARALVEFAKEHARPVVKVGIIGEKLYTREEILQIAMLPPRDELLALIAGTIVAPLTTLLGAVNALIASPAQLADALETKQQG